MFLRFLILGCLVLFSHQALAVDLPDFSALVEKQGAAVVNVSTSQSSRGTQNLQGLEGDVFNEFLRRFGQSLPRDEETQSLGSGFIISADGYILTNAHVIEGADKITVRLTDKREFKAKLIGFDKRTDVALLKIEATGLPKITVGDANGLKVGEWVLAIGSPFGLENSVTAGIVSAKGRALSQENFVPFIQTDVAINPGNSGGPLFNLRGEVVGINSQIYSRSGGYMGLSFAIPIDVAMNVVGQLRSTGRVTRGRIGVIIQELTRELADSFKLEKLTGALISGVERGGPADKAGILPSDVILMFNGKVVNVASDLPRMVAGAQPGQKVLVKLWRAGEMREVTLTVGELASERRSRQTSRRDRATPDVATDNNERLGLSLAELTDDQKHSLHLESGLLVEESRGAAARSEIRRGDVILAIANVSIRSIAQLNDLLQAIPKGKNVALLVKRGDTASFVVVKLDEK